MASVVRLRCKPNRMGNSKQAYVTMQGNTIIKVSETSAIRECLEVKVSPSEINDIFKQAKLRGVYK